MLLNVYRFTLLTFGVIMAVNQLGINVGAALAGLGVVGLTIGFAAKDTLSNIMAGFLIFWDKPFHTDDWVTLDDNYGKVTEITMRLQLAGDGYGKGGFDRSGVDLGRRTGTPAASVRSRPDRLAATAQSLQSS